MLICDVCYFLLSLVAFSDSPESVVPTNIVYDDGVVEEDTPRTYIADIPGSNKLPEGSLSREYKPRSFKTFAPASPEGSPNSEMFSSKPGSSKGAFKTFAPRSLEGSSNRGAFSYRPSSKGAFKLFASRSLGESSITPSSTEDSASPFSNLTSKSKQIGNYTKPTHIQDVNDLEIPACPHAVMVTSSVVDLFVTCFRLIALTKDVCQYTIPLNQGHDDATFKDLRWNSCVKIFSVSQYIVSLGVIIFANDYRKDFAKSP